MVTKRQIITIGQFLVLLIIPFVWSWYTVNHTVNTTLPTAGPSASISNRIQNGPGGNNNRPPQNQLGNQQRPPRNSNLQPPQGSNNQQPPDNTNGQFPPANMQQGNLQFPGGLAGPGGMGTSTPPDKNLVTYLQNNSSGIKYAITGFSSMETSSYVLYTDLTVATLGGFSGQDDTSTADQLSQKIANKTFKFFLVGNSGGPGLGRDSQSLTTWITTNCKLIEATQYSGNGNLNLYRCD
jgi:hypothetical protein